MATLKLSLRDNGIWYAVGTINGKKINHSSGFTKPDKKAAREWLLHHELELIKNAQPNCMESEKFGALVDLYVKDQPQMSDKEYRQIQIVLRHLADKAVKSVRTDLSNYIQTRHANSKHNTVERDVNSRIGAIINYARDKGWCGSFKASVKHIDDTRNLYLSKELRDQFINHWEGEAREFTIILVFQGLRFGQAARLRGMDIMGDQLKTYTQKGPQKIYREEYLYMSPVVEQILTKRAVAVGQEALLFPEIEYDNYRYQHRVICKKLGIPDYRIHDNRSTFATHFSHDAQASDREVAAALTQRTNRNVPRYAQNRKMKELIGKLT